MTAREERGRCEPCLGMGYKGRWRMTARGKAWKLETCRSCGGCGQREPKRQTCPTCGSPSSQDGGFCDPCRDSVRGGEWEEPSMCEPNDTHRGLQ